MVKGEKLAVNHGDAEGSKFFCIHCFQSDLKVSRPKQIACQSVSPLWKGQSYKVKDVTLATTIRQQTRQSVNHKSMSQDSYLYQSCSDKGVR